MPRRPTSTTGGLCYLAVLALAAAGMIVVATGHWRLGVDLLAAAMLSAGAARAALPGHEAGMLKVRAKWFDVSLLVVISGLLFWLAWTVPNAG